MGRNSPEVLDYKVVALASPGLGDGESEIGSFGHEGGFGGFSLTLVRDGAGVEGEEFGVRDGFGC